MFPKEIHATENSSTNSNINEYYDKLGNYYNPETGEYFQWDNFNSKGYNKSFSFKMRYTLSSNYFKLDGTNVQIELGRVYFEHYNGYKTECCNNHRFQVNLRRNGTSNNISNFNAPFGSATSSLGGGFSTTANYLIEITNIAGLPSSVYLTGSGSVYSYGR